MVFLALRDQVFAVPFWGPLIASVMFETGNFR
jgi:hypothetical protein